jgi:hypothetical protein
MLLALPHGALLDLLKSDTLRVASENTVAYTIQAWAVYQQQQQQQQYDGSQGQQQQQQQQYPSLEQLRQLALQIRMQNCSQLYISTVMVHMPALAPCYTAAQWTNACALGLRSSGVPECRICFLEARKLRRLACEGCDVHQPHCEEHQLLCRHVPTVVVLDAWCASIRHRSIQHDAIALQWQLHASDLAACVDAALPQPYCTGEIIWPVYGPARVWAGRAFQFMAGFVATRSDAGCIVLHAELLEHGQAVCSCAARVTAQRARQGAAPAEHVGAGFEQDIELVPPRQVQLLAWDSLRDVMLGSVDMLGIGPLSSGLEAERQLRQAQLVHADGCLHLTLELTSPWVM